MFAEAYGANRAEMNQTVIEGDLVATAIRSLMTGRKIAWTGTAQMLLPELAAKVGEPATKAKTWPTSPRALSGRLRRAAPNLRRVGISILFSERSAKERRIMITADDVEIQPSQPSSPSSTEEIYGVCNHSRDDGRGTDDGTTVIKRSSKPAANDCSDGVSVLLSGGASPRPKQRRITL